MGLFSSKKKTYVSSVIYNLAGPPEDRPDYLKSVILGNVLTQDVFRAGKTIQSAYQSGTGLRLRSYHRWSRTNYRLVGVPTDRFLGKRNLNPDVVEALLLSEFGITAHIDWIDSGPAEIEMWGRQWMREHMPLKEATDDWTADYIEATNEVLINFTDGTAPIRFTPSGYRDRGDYLYVSYSRPMQTNRWSTPLLLIYQRGTGKPAMDALFNTGTSGGEYLPFIPFRHENQFLSQSYKPDVYEQAKKAYKKSTGQKFDTLVNQIKDNPDLKEIDFAYIFFGPSLNTVDKASRRYIFAYLKYLAGGQLIGSNAYNSWVAEQPSIADGQINWLTWYQAQFNNPPGSPLTGASPFRPAPTGVPGNSVIIEDRGPAKTNFKIEISWQSITQSSGTGVGRAGAKKGDVWFTFANGQTINVNGYTNEEAEKLKIDTVEAYYQVTHDQWQKLVIVGLKHTNHIYNGKSVEITAAQALVDVDESGFLVPIQYDVFREMSLVDSTQMSTQCVNIVFNCYQIVKKKWYQRGWFKVLLVIAIVVISVVTGGVGAGTVGLLGTNASVGMALGFAGLAATIAGAIANMVAAMLLTKLITVASMELFGDKIGAIVAAIASVVAVQVGSMMQAGQSLSTAWTSLMEPMNLLALTNAVGNGYAGFLQADTMEIMNKTREATDDFRKQTLDLQARYAEEFGYGNAQFNPMSLTQVGHDFFTESSEAFLNRTLLTGSDIASMNGEMITNFVELTLRNEFSEDQ